MRAHAVITLVARRLTAIDLGSGAARQLIIPRCALWIVPADIAREYSFRSERRANFDRAEREENGGDTRDSGGAMTDGSVQTDGGSGDGGGACAGVDCSSLDDACNVGACDPAIGACSATPREDGTACDDGVACTTAASGRGGPARSSCLRIALGHRGA